jgi:glycosyltransferase involved in cell wall biosynthesis
MLLKVLLVTLFFPPTGGGGVQRPLRFAEQLAALGHVVHVLAPDDAKWPERDASLRVPPSVSITRARNFSPRTQLLGRELYGASPLARIGAFARSVPRRALVPDPSVLWLAAAVPSALRLVSSASIDVVLTSSPPSSVHLVGAAVKRSTGVAWVADVRDSIVNNPHRRFDVRGERALARIVAHYADALATTSAGIADEFSELGAQRVSLIESGCDLDGSARVSHRRSSRMLVTHTGSFLGRRDPRPFCAALAESNRDIVARFVGTFRQRDADFATSLGLGKRLELVPSVAHAQSLAYQRDSDVLLLIVPEAAGRGVHVLTGKLFEYLAARRPVLAAVPPQGEAARLIERAHAGIVVPPDDVGAIARALSRLHQCWRCGGLTEVVLPPDVRRNLAWSTRAAQLGTVLERVTA